ncbi:HK97 gp10 family phage protein [Devosia lacusdianchii]|uniref:HK97 gp10 family phage protein n=1 Tax=Devosia lacusdianchii TaxID=2917991 RepID=UPI001F05999B|nr:HK97 gp10 family phage protein [Devosia sp. JXJ CY 41]
MATFEAEVAEWARKVQGAELLIFQESAQELVSQLTALTPVDTGFLRSSLRASTAAMPVMSLDNPGAGAFNVDVGEISLVIAGADIGDTIYLGYTANYGAYIHYGANGRAGRPWVAMVAQRWQQIVNEQASEVRSRLGP